MRLGLKIFGWWIMGLPILLHGQEPQAFSHTEKRMGSNFGYTAVHVRDTAAWEAILAADAEVVRIEKLISSWDPNSQTSEINRMAGIEPVEVEPELYGLIARSLKISRLTEGCFDISFASIDRLWKFDGSMTQLPDEADIRASVARINYQNIILDPERHSVFLKEKGMKIGFGGIGKGYAANRAAAVMKEMGIEAGVVNAGGDLLAWGSDPKGEPWHVGIADPEKPGTVLAWIPAFDGAIVTSGDYERFAMIDGVRYSHIIDPRTGYPATGIKSVTITCPDAELADAIATSVFVLGVEKGKELVDKLANVECLIITDQNKTIASKLLTLMPYRLEDEEK